MMTMMTAEVASKLTERYGDRGEHTMREPERKFYIHYWSEVSAEISLIRTEPVVAGTGSIVAKARHPSGTGMSNWFHFSETEYRRQSVRASAEIAECEDERDAVLTCLSRLTEKLWDGMDWKVEREEDFDKDTFYKDMLQAFFVGEWTVKHGRLSEDALPPKGLSSRGNK